MSCLHFGSISCSLDLADVYYYVVGDDEYGWSEESSFVAPKQPDPTVTTRVVAFGGELVYCIHELSVYTFFRLQF